MICHIQSFFLKSYPVETVNILSLVIKIHKKVNKNAYVIHIKQDVQCMCDTFKSRGDKPRGDKSKKLRDKTNIIEQRFKNRSILKHEFTRDFIKFKQGR